MLAVSDAFFLIYLNIHQSFGDAHPVCEHRCPLLMNRLSPLKAWDLHRSTTPASSESRREWAGTPTPPCFAWKYSIPSLPRSPSLFPSFFSPQRSSERLGRAPDGPLQPETPTVGSCGRPVYIPPTSWSSSCSKPNPTAHLRLPTEIRGESTSLLALKDEGAGAASYHISVG